MNLKPIHFMKIKRLLPYLVLPFAWILPAASVVALGTNEVEATFAAQMQSLESLYDSRQYDVFCANIKAAAKAALDEPGQYPADASVRILDSLSAKITNSTCAELPSIGEQLALNIIQSDRDLALHSQDAARSLASFLGAIRSERIPNFVALPVSANVAPPEGVPGFAGMDPNAISDPGAKAKYLEALKANERNHSINQRQAQLGQVDRFISRQVLSYVGKVVKKWNVPSSEVDQWVTSGKLNESERARIVQ
jgi:hypothetical protein